MSDLNQKRMTWGDDAVSREIDGHVTAMPDRPRLVVAVISYDISRDKPNRAVLSPFADCLYKEVPMKGLGQKLTITYFGFDIDEAGRFADFLRVLDAVDFDESLIYVDGLPSLHAKALDHTKA